MFEAIQNVSIIANSFRDGRIVPYADFKRRSCYRLNVKDIILFDHIMRIFLFTQLLSAVVLNLF
jgi:hypothetical protein